MATNFRTKINYNLALVKNNCALFSPTPLFSGPCNSMVSLKFFPCRLLLPWQQILGQSDYNSAPVKDNCSLFASSSRREAFSRSIPPLRYVAKTSGLLPAAERRSLIFPCPGRSDGSKWWEVDHERVSNQEMVGHRLGLLVCMHLPSIFRPALSDGVI